MQVYSQTSTSTTLPRSPSGVSGAEFTHRCALSAGSRLAAPDRDEPATMLATRSGRMVLIRSIPRIEALREVPPLRHYVRSDLKPEARSGNRRVRQPGD